MGEKDDTAATNAAVSSEQQPKSSRTKPKKNRQSSSSSSNKNKDKNKKKQQKMNPTALQTWRFYGISVHPDDLSSTTNKSATEKNSLDPALQQSLNQKIQSCIISKTKKQKTSPSTGLPSLDDVPPTYDDDDDDAVVTTKVVRRSLDARKKLDHPSYSYVVDMTLPAGKAKQWGFKVQSGKMELLLLDSNSTKTKKVEESTRQQLQNNNNNDDDDDDDDGNHQRTAVIVGAGPAGLFCALQLALNGVKPILLDRGQPVEQRGRDIGALIHRRSLNMESNFAFGEGGAGTWSDGKLTTRIGRNSDSVRWILETLVEYGAPASILWEGSPHLGTDNLVRLLRNMRRHLQELGGEIHFGCKMTDIILQNNNGHGNDTAPTIQGVKAHLADGSDEIVIGGDVTVLATGHSARDTYERLHQAGVQLEAKGFAVGFRIEHPQKLINQIQYGNEWGPSVQTGRRPTDAANMDYFGADEPEHSGRLPVPSYRLATDKADDGEGKVRGVYSFCMCPGGQIVPSSTDPNEVCVNGMSFSKRDSVWANSALVVTVQPDDEILEPYRAKYGVMAGLEFQRDMEQTAARLGGGNWTVPVQRVTDFCQGQISETIPTSSYRLGVKSAPCHEIYPPPITHALRDALTNHFGEQMNGYYHEDGLLHAVETRTSSPLRISRDPETCQAIGISNLFPAGEGAGFAGGIVSAAVDGRNVAEAILDKLQGTDRPGRVEKSKSIGFSY